MDMVGFRRRRLNLIRSLSDFWVQIWSKTAILNQLVELKIEFDLQFIKKLLYFTLYFTNTTFSTNQNQSNQVYTLCYQSNKQKPKLYKINNNLNY